MTRRREPLTRARVLQAALDLADTEGLDALSMRHLAAALGVKAMSLYNHVAHKDDLLDALVDEVVGEIDLWPPGTPWKVAMRQRALSAHAVLMAHPWACAQLMSRANVGPNMLRYVDTTLATLFQAGLSEDTADHVWNALDSYLYGFTLHALRFPFEPSEYRTVAAAYLPTLADGRHPALRRMTVSIVEGHHDGLHDLSFGLDLLLDGLERALADRAPA